MTTLHRLPEATPKIAPLAPPPPIDPTRPARQDPATTAQHPAPTAEILPMLIERPAWPRIFPGL